MKRIWKIDVPGPNGYSFAIKGNIENESVAIAEAYSAELFYDGHDAEYATAEDITDSEYDIKAFKNYTHEV